MVDLILERDTKKKDGTREHRTVVVLGLKVFRSKRKTVDKSINKITILDSTTVPYTTRPDITLRHFTIDVYFLFSLPSVTLISGLDSYLIEFVVCNIFLNLVN